MLNLNAISFRKGVIMDNGWSKLYRSLLHWRWFKFSETLHLFIYCILKANHKDISWQGIEIKRGEFVTSLKTITEETGLTTQKIRTSTNRLKSTSEITIKSTNKYTIITVCNYDVYQTDAKGEQQAEQQANQQTTNKQVTTNKNEKNIKNIKKENKEKVASDFSGCSFVKDNFREVFKMWLDYKAEKKKSYKGEKSAKICYNQILKLSGENVEVARKIIEQSMANNWDGLFELSKTNPSTQPEPTKKGLTTWKAN